MYKLMVVDDEVMVRDALIELLDLEALGFTLAGTASNGVEALEYFDEDDVEVLITDINMPFLDGLELVHEIRKRGNDCRVIFLTGYDEFEYAKEAVALNVEKYILKPITKNEITDVLKDIKLSLDEKYSQSQQIEKLKADYDKNKRLFEEMSIFGILDGQLPDSMLVENIKSLNENVREDDFVLASVIEISSFKDLVERGFASNYSMFFYTIMEFSRNDLSKKGEFLLIKGKENKIVVICLNPDKTGNIEFIFNHLIRNINLTFNVDVSIGMGSKNKGISSLKKSYNDAMTSLGNQLIDGSNRVIVFRENMNPSSIDEAQVYKKISNIIDAIRVNDRSKINKNLDLFFSLLSFNCVESSVFRTYVLNLLVKIFENFNKYFDSEKMAIDFSAISIIVNSKSESEIREGIAKYIDGISQAIEKSKSDERKEIIREASEYLKENYQEPLLDLTTLASELHVSTSYISKEFKRIKGKTVIEFLTDIRMDKAKELLKTTNLKVFEISMQVGYEDANYFSYNFRKHIGTSPLKYRKS